MKRKFFLAALLFLAFLLCGCGTASPPEEPTPPAICLPDGTVPEAAAASLELAAPSPETLAQTVDALKQLPTLKHVRFTEPLAAADYALFCREIPAVCFEAELSAAGRRFSSSASALDFTGLTPEEADALSAVLPYLDHLKTVELGSRESSPQLSLGDVKRLQESCPDVDFSYSFPLYGQTVSSCDRVLDLSHREIEDRGAAVFEAVSVMPRLEMLDMDSCGVSNEDMAKIRDAYPQVKVVWRIWFGENYTVRTDVERILASKPGVGGIMTEENTEALKYCTEVKYLDLGHNPDLETIEFVRYMPKLEVAILAMDLWSDCSPLAACTELEYLEIQTTEVSDISALAGLTKLRHLNICYLFDLTDISPLYGLTQLERLWIGCLTPIPGEQVEKMQELAPDCVINTRTLDPTDQEWRYAYTGGLVPRYELLREQFGGYSNAAFAFPWNDPKYQ